MRITATHANRKTYPCTSAKRVRNCHLRELQHHNHGELEKLLHVVRNAIKRPLRSATTNHDSVYITNYNVPHENDKQDVYLLVYGGSAIRADNGADTVCFDPGYLYQVSPSLNIDLVGQKAVVVYGERNR